jgi:metal-responsive CopG/Arc/MetJ family transcriptional regulator
MKKMGRPPVDTEAVTVRLPRELIAALDDARREDPEMPTRQEVIRRVLVTWHVGRSAPDDAGAS